MKYRVKQIDNKFYPQYRNFLGFWCNFQTTIRTTFGDQKSGKYYFSLFEAQQFIDRKIKEDAGKSKITIHEYP